MTIELWSGAVHEKIIRIVFKRNHQGIPFIIACFDADERHDLRIMCSDIAEITP